MLILGIILLLIGWLTGIGILSTLGLILVIIGLLLMVIPLAGGPTVGGRRWW